MSIIVNSKVDRDQYPRFLTPEEALVFFGKMGVKAEDLEDIAKFPARAEDPVPPHPGSPSLYSEERRQTLEAAIKLLREEPGIIAASASRLAELESELAVLMREKR